MSEGDPIGAAAPRLEASHGETAGPHGKGATTPPPRTGPTGWPWLDLGCGLLVLNFDDPSDRNRPNWAEEFQPSYISQGDIAADVCR
jgi:hypothetical protein